MDVGTPGASAVEAAQKLIDGGLFADTKAPPAPTGNAAPPAQAGSTAVESKVTEQPTEQKAAPDAPQTNAEAQEEGYASLDDYLAKSSIDRDSFLSLPVKAKVDGKELDVPLAKLVESYQIGEHLAHKSNAFAEERRQWDAERTAARTQLQQQLQAAQTLGQLAQQELLREYQGVTPDDPARYLAAQQRIGAIQQWLAQTAQAQSQVSAAQLAAEQQRLLDAVPEWRDAAKFKEAQDRTAAYVESRGFTDAQLSLLRNAVNGDHQFALMLRDAVRAKDLQAEVDTLKAELASKTAATLKLVRSAPAMVSPGARTQQSPQTSRLQSARSAMHTGKMKGLDAQAAVAQALLDAGAA